MNIPMRIQPNEFDSMMEVEALLNKFYVSAEACPKCPEKFDMVADSCINVEITEGTRYPGPYDVIPKAFEDVILETAYKTMEDDVTVYEIPYAETSNIYGTTVTIAS